jgi:hypothetical protein
MYVYAPSGLGDTLAQSIRKPSVLDQILSQIRREPENHTLFLATVTLHPNPTDSRSWGNKSFTVGNAKHFLMDATLMAGVPDVYALDALRKISADFQRRNRDFRAQIEAAVTLRGDIMNALSILGRSPEKLRPYAETIMLPSLELERERLIRLGHGFAKAMFPKALLDRTKTLTFEVHYTIVARWLEKYAVLLARKDPAFRREVEEKLRMMLDTKNAYLKGLVKGKLEMLRPTAAR